jgi:Nuclear transport factor 2 (NTF2) domain
MSEIATELQGRKECVGKERAGGVEKTRSESSPDVYQVCTIPFSHLFSTFFLNDNLIGRMGWLSTGASGDGPVVASDLLMKYNTFHREATDTEPADTAAAIERALVINDAAIQTHLTPPFQPARKSTPPLARMSQGSDLAQVKGKGSTPSAVEIIHQASVESGDGRLRESVGQSRFCASAWQTGDPSWDPSQEGQSQQPEYLAQTNTGCQTMVNAQAAIACLQRSPAPDTPSDHSRLSMRRQPTSSQSWMSSLSPQAPAERRTTSPDLSQPLQSPSQRAILRHILQLRWNVDHESSELLKPPAISPSPSHSPRKLYPSPKRPTTDSPSKHSTESFADAVAAAINESARLGSSSTPVPSTPLRLYKKRPSSSPAVDLVRRTETSPTPPCETRHQAHRSLSSMKHSSPPIAVLVPVDSSPESLRADLPLSSVYDDEYDELELSYPSSPKPPPQETPLETFQPAILPTGWQVSVEPAEPAELEPASQPPLLGLAPPPPAEDSVMRSVALQYLERYFQTFDVDRHALADAYTPDATFSCSSRNLRAQGRDGVLDVLQRLGHGALCSGDNVEYDVTYLGPDIGVLLVVLGTLSGAGDNKAVGYTMSFLLRPAREDPDRSVWFLPITFRASLSFFFSLTGL